MSFAGQGTGQTDKALTQKHKKHTSPFIALFMSHLKADFWFFNVSPQELLKTNIKVN